MRIRVSQAYLELARSYVSATAISKTSPDQVNQTNRATSTFAFAALSTIFSYAAVEAFVNFGLFELWQHSRLAHDAIQRINEAYPDRKATALFDQFYQKYGKYDEFTDLKETKLRTLTERIKEISRANNIPSLASDHPRLWTNFLELEETRDQLVHPVPKETEFAQLTDRLFSSAPYRAYPQIASDVISYFYDTFKRPRPEFLGDNRLFRIHDIEMLF